MPCRPFPHGISIYPDRSLSLSLKALEMTTPKDLKKQIYACECERCSAIVCLIEQCDAHLKFSPSRAGRLCELAVVAAAGEDGLLKEHVVAERRQYAEHLGVTLSGPTSNADQPVHIDWAIRNSNHNPNAAERINLGRAHASFSDGRYRIHRSFKSS